MHHKLNRETLRKRQERHLLERFLAAAGIEVQEIEESESPDFILHVESKLVGVELTELFREDTGVALQPRAHENITDRIVAAAHRFYHDRSCNFVRVNVAFFDGVDFRSLNRDAVAERLASRVMSMRLESTHVHWRNDYEDPLLNAIATVSALTVPEQRMSHWSVGRAGWRSNLSADLVRSAIESKDAKVCSYRAKVDELWLLLAIEGSRPSQFFDPDKPPAVETLASRFDRTYLFNAMYNQVICWRSSGS
jgi:hypothetical protein